ncbi:uncharacterized protein LOC124448667 [Xenia sp. Carnegie-2017]|uniref:uncharacterized protein LOC124448667 n=1 Tax=Xenia sp. Carnegie-2017 TaxID=2897299 RepID=UPI001F043F0C|nr:uncharacterized protein LOC124448667 [Xenia sp. Carnegie-2017]
MTLENLVISVFGIILKKFRDEVSEKLSDGGVTSKTLSDIIKRDLHDIKEKIDFLSRKDLLASLNFLEQGVIRHSKCFDEVKKFELEEFRDAYNGNMSSAACGVIRFKIMHQKNLKTVMLPMKHCVILSYKIYTKSCKGSTVLHEKIFFWV